MSRIHEAKVFEDSAATFLARIVGRDNMPITRANVETVQLRIYDLYEQDTVTLVTSANIESDLVIFDDLQTDSIWKNDMTGYNFKHIVDFASIDTDGRLLLRVEYRIIPTSGHSRYSIAYEINVLELLSH